MNGPLSSAIVVVGPPLPVKMPTPPVSRNVLNATEPLSLREMLPTKDRIGPLVSAMVVVGPPVPVKMPSSPVSRLARNATVPLLLREGASRRRIVRCCRRVC